MKAHLQGGRNQRLVAPPEKQCLIALAAALAALVQAAAQAPVAPAGVTNVAPGALVLDTRTFWRCFQMFRDPVAVTSNGVEALPVAKGKMRWNSAPPPADWTSPAFDDGSWWRAPGPFYGGSGAWNGAIDTVALLCLRGKFAVDDPARVKALTLACVYRGGVVVYLNGKEVQRGHLPEGELTPETLAEVYPIDAYAQTNGTSAIKWGWGDPANYPARCNLRIRQLGEVPVPTGLLRKGMNVLAIEIHRTAYAEGATSLKDWWHGFRCHAGLNSVQLRTDSPAALRSNLARSKGFQVWNANPMMAIFDMDYGDPVEPLHPIRIPGARNGWFSGQVVVSADAPIKGLKGEMSALRPTGGGEALGADVVQVRYAKPGGTEGGADARYGTQEVNRFDALEEAAPVEVPVYAKTRGLKPCGAVQPIWITVNVPSNAAAGEYTGTLTVRAAGERDAAVPVVLTVADWALPAPERHDTFVDVIQSPESVALHYEAPLWSDRHWQLMERSFRQLARIGNKTVYIPLICKTHFGNSESMVRWVKQADGGHQGDFGILDKYLDLAQRHLGQPPIVCFYVWDHFCGGGYFGGTHDAKRVKKTPVSLVDPQANAIATFDGPTYFEPEAEAFFAPIAAGVRARMKQRGLEKSMTIGICSDVRAVKPQVELWKKLLPEARWVIHTHGELTNLHGVPVAYLATVWQARFAPDPSEGHTYGWTRDFWNHRGQEFVQFNRDMVFGHPITENRLLAERNVSGTQSGFGRNGADFWSALKDGKGNRIAGLVNRYPESNWAQLSVKTCLLAPGPDGALSTVRWEMMVEGVQECEAKIFLEKALVDKARRAKLGEELAQRAQGLLDDRIRAAEWGWQNPGWFVSSGWQDRTARLYALAAETATALRK